MWSSNGTLRTLSSASTRHALRTHARWASFIGSPARSISASEFLYALRNICLWDLRHETMPVAFAVSGGVDSMALAALWARASKSGDVTAKAHALIVNHKARPESTEEAAWVAKQVRSKLNMSATVLPLTWPATIDPLSSKNFETSARQLRYQALGRACSDLGAQYLMVAHHADDQAETLLMRLSQRRLRTGLKGMEPSCWIPECEGIYGVHHSGNELRLGLGAGQASLAVTSGGTRLLRPLLGFEKARLVATCEELSMEWREDKSNTVQTLTMRNAIRHVRHKQTLPKALSGPVLLELSKHMQGRVKAHEVFAEQLFDRCKLKLDIQTGTLFVRFPAFEHLLSKDIVTESHRNEAWNNAHHLVKRVVDLVSPVSKPDISKYVAAIEKVYPQFSLYGRDDSVGKRSAAWNNQRILHQNSFTSCSLYWRCSGGSSPSENIQDNQVSDIREWSLIRQSPSHLERRTFQPLEYPPSQLDIRSGLGKPSKKDQYQLFDNRFWISIRNFTSSTLVIKFFNPADGLPPSAAKFRNRRADKFESRPERFIATALKLRKPNYLRDTLPSLPALYQRNIATGEETLVGFPTLNISMTGAGEPLEICEWDVMYKKIDPGSRPVKALVAGIMT